GQPDGPDRQGPLRGRGGHRRGLPDGPRPPGRRRHYPGCAPRSLLTTPTRREPQSMKILLTGGAGYIGSACLRWLLGHGHDPIAFDNMYEGNASAVPEGRLVVGDICDTALLTRTLQEHKIE